MVGRDGILVAAAIPAVLAATMSFMMFDAPGSTESPLTVALFLSTLVASLFCLRGAAVPWFFGSKPFGKWLFCIPLIDLTALTMTFVANRSPLRRRLRL